MSKAKSSVHTEKEREVRQRDGDIKGREKIDEMDSERGRAR